MALHARRAKLPQDLSSQVAAPAGNQHAGARAEFPQSLTHFRNPLGLHVRRSLLSTSESTTKRSVWERKSRTAGPGLFFGLQGLSVKNDSGKSSTIVSNTTQ